MSSDVTFARPALGAEAHGKLVVVVGRESPIEELSVRDLRRLYLGEHLSDDDGGKIVAFNQPRGASSRVHFDELVLKMTPEEVGRFWVDRRIRGQRGARRSLRADLLIRVVATMPGALGYLAESDVDERVKTIAINGSKPQEDDYPLRY